jgi:hypothetical protein
MRGWLQAPCLPVSIEMAELQEVETLTEAEAKVELDRLHGVLSVADTA